MANRLNQQRTKVIAAAVVIFLAAVSAFAKPAFMDRYNTDPYGKAELRGKCTVCHIGHGGGERNDFGEAFADAGYRITPKLRSKFPQLFIDKSCGSQPTEPSR
jgi:hypothetical protein